MTCQFMMSKKNQSGSPGASSVSTWIIALLAAASLSGCATPELKAPEVDIPAAFKEQATPSQADGEINRWKIAQPSELQSRGEWWKAFGDTALNQLIDEAATANQNLEAAAARVRQARAVAGVAEADRIPKFNAQFGPQRGRGSPLSFGLPEGTQVAPLTVWQGLLTANYEVDLFNRVGSNISAARADAAASEATYRSVLLALQADVAQLYFQLRATDAELVLLNGTVSSREESVRINQRRFEIGDIGELDLARARTELFTTRADTVAVERRRTQLEHALAVLLGKPASSFTLAGNPMQESTTFPVIPAGLPSTLLERRPDIAAAQRAMVAANARIGVARSAVFPALVLTASGGGESDQLSDLFKWSSRTWLIGALMSLPIIDGGRNHNNIARTEAALEESVAGYRQSVLSAFAEVEDNLSGLRTLTGQTQAINDAVLSARRSADLARKLYAAGRSGYLEVLDAQRNQSAIERSAVQLRGLRATTTVALIRSLGGGW